jgi:hypothetical protein
MVRKKRQNMPPVGRPRKYWNDLKKKLLFEGYDELSEKIGQLKMKSADGKYYATDCANTETLCRADKEWSLQGSPEASHALVGKPNRGSVGADKSALDYYLKYA